MATAGIKNYWILFNINDELIMVKVVLYYIASYLF